MSDEKKEAFHSLRYRRHKEPVLPGEAMQTRGKKPAAEEVQTRRKKPAAEEAQTRGKKPAAGEAQIRRKKPAVRAALAAGAVLTVTALAAGGCGRRVETCIGGENRDVTLRTVSMSGGTAPGTGVYEEIRLEFMAENPHIYIEDEMQTSDEQWKTGVVTDFSVGNEPDVLQFFTDATANQLVAMDKFVTIEEIREIYPEYAADTYDWALKQAANQDGVSRAVPTVGFWEGLYVNQELFERCGLVLPYDWDSLLEAVSVFRENGIVPVSCALANVPHYWLEHLLLYTAGKEGYLNPGSIAPKDWVQAVSLFQILREAGAFPEDTDSITNEYAGELFVSKKAAMLLEGSWYFSSVTDTEHTLVIPFPGVPDQKAEPGTVIGGITSGFYITRRAWNDLQKRDAAVKYVMAHTGREAVQRYYEAGGSAVAAAPVTVPETPSPLAECAAEYVENAPEKLLPTDSRMEPEAYRTLIAGIPEVSAGGSGKELLERVFAASGRKGGFSNVQGDDY